MPTLLSPFVVFLSFYVSFSHTINPTTQIFSFHSNIYRNFKKNREKGTDTTRNLLPLLLSFKSSIIELNSYIQPHLTYHFICFQKNSGSSLQFTERFAVYKWHHLWFQHHLHYPQPKPINYHQSLKNTTFSTRFYQKNLHRIYPIREHHTVWVWNVLLSGTAFSPKRHRKFVGSYLKTSKASRQLKSCMWCWKPSTSRHFQLQSGLWTAATSLLRMRWWGTWWKSLETKITTRASV